MEVIQITKSDFSEWKQEIIAAIRQEFKSISTNDKLLTPKEAASELGISPKSFYEQVNKRNIKPDQIIGTRKRFLKSTLLKIKK